MEFHVEQTTTENGLPCAHRDRCKVCNGVDLSDLGYIWFSDHIDEETAEMFRQELLKMALDRKNHVRDDLSEDITIMLETPGGQVDAGMAIYSTMRYVSDILGVPIKAHVQGMAASMGAVLLQGADERIMSPVSKIMIHNVKGFMMGDMSGDDLATSAALFEDSLKSICSIIANRNTGGKDDYKWWVNQSKRKDWYINAEEALKLGLIDRIA